MLSVEQMWYAVIIYLSSKRNKTHFLQAFKMLRANSCTSDVETRMNFKKMDKYSWFQSIKWMEKSNYNTFWHSAEPWLSLSISWDENNKLECESFCSIFTYVWALSCNFCLIYNSQDNNNTRRTWIGSGCLKSLIFLHFLKRSQCKLLKHPEPIHVRLVLLSSWEL